MQAEIQRGDGSGVPLEKPSAEALRQCIRILGLNKPAATRVTMWTVAQDFVSRGVWPMFRPEELSALFYPEDEDRAASLLERMALARSAGRLPELISASHVAAWPDCPKVPPASPLRAWLPDWMHETP